jgi:hypothetical protein
MVQPTCLPDGTCTHKGTGTQFLVEYSYQKGPTINVVVSSLMSACDLYILLALHATRAGIIEYHSIHIQQQQWHDDSSRRSQQCKMQNTNTLYCVVAIICTGWYIWTLVDKSRLFAIKNEILWAKRKEESKQGPRVYVLYTKMETPMMSRCLQLRASTAAARAAAAPSLTVVVCSPQKEDTTTQCTAAARTCSHFSSTMETTGSWCHCWQIRAGTSYVKRTAEAIIPSCTTTFWAHRSASTYDTYPVLTCMDDLY